MNSGPYLCKRVIDFTVEELVLSLFLNTSKKVHKKLTSFSLKKGNMLTEGFYVVLFLFVL